MLAVGVALVVTASSLLVFAAPAGAQTPDWTARLPVFAAAMRGCLDGDTTAYADAVARQQAFAVAVRLRRGAATEVCVARPDGRVLRRSPLDDALPPDPAAPAFFLERRCADARRQQDPDGTVLGWLAYPGC